MPKHRFPIFAATGLTALAVSAGCALPAAGAAQAFTGNVCSLLKSPQLQAVEVQPVCKARPPVNVRGRVTIYGGFWGGAGNIADPSYHRLTVQVWQARSSSFAAIFMKRARGVPVKIGSFARAEVAAGGENLYILVAGYGVAINLTHQVGTTAQNIGEIGTPMANIGKAIAKQLK